MTSRQQRIVNYIKRQIDDRIVNAIAFAAEDDLAGRAEALRQIIEHCTRCVEGNPE
jgi:hypothetical protein